ncbi:MAG: PilT/PilU family type 4a pilus ATPase [Bdellovibrionaceae bacterium]|nr:PilT/PilU family type 4a pilus ATPase [Pseudobdellovibrionaceae bacterium]
MNIQEILKEAIKKSASDIHLKVGMPPIIRKHGKLQKINASATKLTSEDMIKIMEIISQPKDQKSFEKGFDLDIAYSLPQVGRFRVSLTKQRGSTRIVFRLVNFKIPSISELQLPSLLEKIALKERGLILVTGATGSGKTSTLVSMLNHINHNKNKHILTLENPIEYLIRDYKSIITQREVGTDVQSFKMGLRSALRQDPDVLFIGELRDMESIEIALTASSTGHLVLASIHSTSAKDSITRILSEFPKEKQNYITTILAHNLKAIISLRLCKKKDKSGVVPATEILINNSRVQELILENRLFELESSMEEHAATYGSKTFNQSLFELLDKDLIDFEEAKKMSTNANEFKLKFSKKNTNDDFIL